MRVPHKNDQIQIFDIKMLYCLILILLTMQENPIVKKSHHRRPRAFNYSKNQPTRFTNSYDFNIVVENPESVPDHPAARQQTFGKTNPDPQNDHNQLETSNINSNIESIEHINGIISDKKTEENNCQGKQDEHEYPKIQSISKVYEQGEQQNLILPQLRILKNQSEIRAEIGKIKKQDGSLKSSRYSRNVISNHSSQFDLKSTHSPQHKFNKLALSMMGIQRTKGNYSCIEQRKSMIEFQTQQGINTPKMPSKHLKKVSSKKTNRNNMRRQSAEIQIYDHSKYPFRLDNIQHIKQSIGKVVYDKWAQRRSGLDLYKKNQSNKTKLFHNKARDFGQQIQITLNDEQMNLETFLEIQPPPISKTIKINYKTSLDYIKSLMIKDQLVLQKSIHIEVPSFFINPPSQFKSLSSHSNLDTTKLLNQASYIFSCEQIPVTNLSIKKYSNCVVIINNSVCIVWHTNNKGFKSSAKKYFGSWKCKYFDEGVKQGMGLQWSPGKYVYYGQFQDNKRHGFGLMKRSEGEVLIGYWKVGKYIRFGIQKNV